MDYIRIHTQDQMHGVTPRFQGTTQTYLCRQTESTNLHTYTMQTWKQTRIQTKNVAKSSCLYKGNRAYAVTTNTYVQIRTPNRRGELQ